jgi:hypothetical protein
MSRMHHRRAGYPFGSIVDCAMVRPHLRLHRRLGPRPLPRCSLDGLQWSPLEYECVLLRTAGQLGGLTDQLVVVVQIEQP